MTLKHHARFESQEDWLAYLSTLDGRPSRHCGTDPRESTNDTWSGGTYDNARKLLGEGWQAGADKLASVMRSAINLTQPMTRPTVSYDVAGAFPDVPLAVAGEPLNMFNLGEEMIATRPSVRLWVEMTARGVVQPQNIENFGAALLSQIDAMESADIRCEINLVWTGKSAKSADKYQTTVVAKSAEQPLDIERLAFLMIHPSQLRRIMFDLWARDPSFLAIAESYGYGHCALSETDEDRLGIVIPSVNEQTQSYDTLSGAIARMQSLLEAGLTEIGHPMKFDCLQSR